MENLKNLAIKELRQRAQGGAPEAGRDPIIGHSIRFFSIYITKLLLYTPVTANQVTVLSVLVYLSGISLFILPSILAHLVGCFLVYLSVVLDGCDGEIARLKGNKLGVGGIYVEPISHDIQYALLFIPLTIGVYLQTQSVFIVYAGFVATIVKLLSRFMVVRFEGLVLYREALEGSKIKLGDKFMEFEPNVSSIHRFYRFVNRNLFSSVGLVIPLLLFSLFGRVDIFVYSFAVFFSAGALAYFSKQITCINKMRKPASKRFTSVVLAAGVGSRLGQLTVAKPKPLIEVLGRPIIDYVISWLKHLGSQKIVVIGGYQFNALKDFLISKDYGVTLLNNIDYSTTHRMVSLLRARDEIVGSLLVQDADYIYHRDVKKAIDGASGEEVTVFASRCKSKFMIQDVIAVVDQDSNLLDIYKTSKTEDLGSNQYYFNSLVYVSEKWVTKFFSVADDLVKNLGGKVQVEDVLLEYAKRGGVVKVADAGEPLWVEIDNPAELASAESFVGQYRNNIP